MGRSFHRPRNYPGFNFDQGMACYALAYLIDLHQGRTLPTVYAQGVVNHWGRRLFQYAWNSVPIRSTL